MFESEEKLKDEIRKVESSTFVSRYLFEPIPHSFAGDLDAWIGWKHVLAAHIHVDPKDVVLTGSSALGFSLNPNKNFKPFDQSSDIDCGVISQHYFDLSWRFLRQQNAISQAKTRPVKEAVRQHKQFYIFEGTIATDRILSLLPFGAHWQTALDEMSKLTPTLGRDLNIRIYKDYDSLRYYQARNLGRLKDQIIQGLSDEEEGLGSEDIGVQE